MSSLKKLFVSLILAVVCLVPSATSAAEVYQDLQETFKARVLEVVEQHIEDLPGLGISAEVQTLKVEILDGTLQGQILEVRNDRIMLERGDKFFLNYLKTIEGAELFLVQEPDRTGILYLLVGIFVLTVLVFGGKQGLRSLLSLLGSFLIIFYLLLPQLLKGVSPVIAGLGLSSLILVLAILLTHGVNKKSLSALAGTIITITLAYLFADFAVSASNLTGFSEDTSTYLNLSTGGTLNFTGLLLSAIIIGVLGILDDIAITQASIVAELNETNPTLSRKEVYFKAMRVGHEHVSALVNTLALAYTGAALPLLLYFYGAEAPLSEILSREVFVSEIIRVIVGSVAVILAVPITTLIASVVMIKK